MFSSILQLVNTIWHKRHCPSNRSKRQNPLCPFPLTIAYFIGKVHHESQKFRALGAAARSNRRVLASLRLSHIQQIASLSLPCLGIYHWLRTRAPPTPASQDLSSCATAAPHTLRYIHSFARGETPGNGCVSLVVRFMIERRLRHTSTRGSVAPRRISNRRFTGD